MSNNLATAFRKLAASGQLGSQAVQDFTKCFHEEINNGYERMKAQGFDELWKHHVVLISALIDVMHELQGWIEFQED